MLVSKQPSFLSLRFSAFPSLIVGQLNSLSAGSTALINAFIGVAPVILSLSHHQWHATNDHLLEGVTIIYRYTPQTRRLECICYCHCRIQLKCG
ncbi:hypothetical protein HYPSUDRAFT_618381 [Hypholoma sublateritium FD-334 SS-4]|uniref:Uncharacterized protein n=1 Tax=Hypholoma sublateritium (strain FD-334 SS-4) TaxID=945553 RepID=A0A0D2LLF5_HYPSF|nr:hypothetical protein HYPSUDRAFT_618381 [Hypholoma sublateritium FD-334 SS-4]